MKVVITGGAGFLGKRLASRLLQRSRLTAPDGREREIRQIVLFDRVAAEGFDDERIRVVAGDIADPATLEEVIGSDTDSVFHLAAIVSGQAEADFDLGMRVNLDASRLLLETCRRLPHRPRVIFTSSVAVFGGDLPEKVQDSTALTPQSSYGTQKAIAELLLNDYSRKGFLDGRCLRLPTVSVRPGLPNKAASSFASGIIREPLAGVEAVCPVAPTTKMWLLSPRSATENLIIGHEIDAARLGHYRSINLPGLSVSVAEMVAALERVAGRAVTNRIRWQHDPVIERIVSTWPGDFETTRAESLGFVNDASFDEVVRAYIDDDMPAAQRAALA